MSYAFIINGFNNTPFIDIAVVVSVLSHWLMYVSSLSRNGLLVVETGVKAHKATQRSSSLGKTILNFISVIIISQQASIIFTCQVAREAVLIFFFYCRPFYIPIMCTFARFWCFIIAREDANKRRRGVFNRTHALRRWHWVMGMALGSLCSSLSSCHPYVLY